MRDGGDHILAASGISFGMEEEGPVSRFTADGTEFTMEMPGMFNVYNALAALQAIRCLDLDISQAAETLRKAHVKGRMERILVEKNIACYIDYAHNAMSLQCVLTTLKVYQPGRILLVFGCGGGRAASRRLEMGKVAGRLADMTIITSDSSAKAAVSDWRHSVTVHIVSKILAFVYTFLKKFILFFHSVIF